LITDEKRSRLFRVLGMAVATASIAMMMAAAMMPWAALNGKTKVGPIPVSLDADMMEYGINYKADLGNLSDAPLFSGLGSKIPSGMSGNKVFLTGLGEFQETIGFVKGTSKEKVIKVNTYTWNQTQKGTADARMTTYVKTIPWWPVGLGQDVGMKVELTAAYNISELKVQKVWFELQLPAKGNGTPLHKTVWETSPGDSLKKVGDEKTYWGKAVVDDDYGEFSVLGYVQLELFDEYGNSNKKEQGGYNEVNPGPREIKLWTMSTEKTARIALMAGAFPITIAGTILLATGAAMGLFGNGRDRLGRLSWKLCLAGFILSILAVPFYVTGVNALIDLTGYTSWLSWRPVFYLAIAGASLSVVPGIMLFLVRPPAAPRPVKDEKGEKKEAAKTPEKTSEGRRQPPTNLKGGNA